MDWLIELLGGFWWWGCDGRSKTADAGNNYMLPVLLVVAAGCLIALVCLR